MKIVCDECGKHVSEVGQLRKYFVGKHHSRIKMICKYCKAKIRKRKNRLFINPEFDDLKELELNIEEVL